MFRSFPDSVPFLVYHGFNMAAESAANEGVMKSCSRVIRVEDNLRQRQKSTLETRFDCARYRLAISNAILGILNMVDLGIDDMQVVLLGKILAQPTDGFRGRGLWEALHTATVVPLIRLQNLRNVSHINRVSSASSAKVSEKGLINRDLLLSERG
jgi:hypothetical protein